LISRTSPLQILQTEASAASTAALPQHCHTRH